MVVLKRKDGPKLEHPVWPVPSPCGLIGHVRTFQETHLGVPVVFLNVEDLLFSGAGALASAPPGILERKGRGATRPFFLPLGWRFRCCHGYLRERTGMSP